MHRKVLLLTSFLLLSFPQSSIAGHAQASGEQFAQAGSDYMTAGKFDAAIDQYSKAIKLDKSNARYYQGRAKAQAGAKRLKPAISDLSKAIRLAPNLPDNYAYRSQAYESLRDYKKEKDDLDKLLTLQPVDGSTLLRRAQANIHLNKNMQQVIDDCNKALNFGLQREQLVILYKAKATAYKNLGKNSEYQQEMAKYQSLMP